MKNNLNLLLSTANVDRPNAAPLVWEEMDGAFTTSIDLPEGFLDGVKHITPSFSAINAGSYAFQFSLNGVALSAFGCPQLRENLAPQAPEQDNIRPNIDTLELSGPLSGAQLELTVLPCEPALFREAPSVLSAPVMKGAVEATALNENILLDVDPKSQMEQDPEIARRICSPTSVSMVLDYYGKETTPEEMAQMTRYTVEEAPFGVWPQNIYAASLHGVLGKLTHFSRLDQLEHYLKQGIPPIVSIGYDKGELTGARVPQTKGHLVVVIGCKDTGRICINDPRGETADHVPGCYDAEEFARAWSRRLGLGYILFKP